jgi:hypothetical protein
MGVAAGLSMHKLLGEYAHTGIERGLMERRRVSGHPRGFRLHVMLSAQLELALMKSVRHRHRSKSRIVEEALWKDLGGPVVRLQLARPGFQPNSFGCFIQLLAYHH